MVTVWPVCGLRSVQRTLGRGLGAGREDRDGRKGEREQGEPGEEVPHGRMVGGWGAETGPGLGAGQNGPRNANWGKNRG
jgi:hypothetical protein